MQNSARKLILNQETVRNLTSSAEYFILTPTWPSVGCPGTNNCTPTKQQEVPAFLRKE